MSHTPRQQRYRVRTLAFASWRLLGTFEFGVTVPSMMGGTTDCSLRANCFAVTQPTAGSLPNMHRVAEYLRVTLG